MTPEGALRRPPAARLVAVVNVAEAALCVGCVPTVLALLRSRAPGPGPGLMTAHGR